MSTLHTINKCILFSCTESLISDFFVCFSSLSDKEFSENDLASYLFLLFYTIWKLLIISNKSYLI